MAKRGNFGSRLSSRTWTGRAEGLPVREMPLPVQPLQLLVGAKRSCDRPSPSHSADSPTAAPPMKKVRMTEIQIQTAETSETLEKKDKD